MLIIQPKILTGITIIIPLIALLFGELRIISGASQI